jgi:hypothetical protein
MQASNTSSSPGRNALPRTESPSRPFLPRSRSVKALLPATDDVVFSTRGQALPVLISQLSSSFAAHRTLTRRGSFFISPEDVAQHAQDLEARQQSTELERPLSRDIHDVPPPPSRKGSILVGAWAAEAAAEDRRRNEIAVAALNTPQMRSMRLIGNSNARYQW